MSKKEFLTFRYHYKCTKQERNMLRLLCHISKNLYNSALYELRKQYFKSKSICDLYDLFPIMKDNLNYHLLNTYSSLCICRCAHNNMDKFINNPEKDCCSLPGYLKKNSYYPIITDQVRPIIYNNKKCIKLPLSNLTRTSKIFKEVFEDELVTKFIKESELKESFNIYFPIPKEIKDNKIHQIRIVPQAKATYFTIEFSYEKPKAVTSRKDGTIMGIDLGVSNLATCYTLEKKGFIIDGKRLKSINQLYNKKKAKVQSLLPKKVYNSKKTLKLDVRRNNQIEDYLNKAVKQLLVLALENNVNEIVIGWNKGIKNGGVKTKKSTSKKNKAKANQSFLGIPFSKFKNKLIFKAKQYGFIVTETEESYTSKASSIDGDKLSKSIFSGKRICRGLYQRNNKEIINADSNGALNIIRKVKSISNDDLLNHSMSRGLTSPCRVQVTL